SAGRPVKVKTTLMTGMLIFGKMSVGVRNAAVVPKIKISSAMTTKVYGRRSASRTTPIMTSSDAKRRFHRVIRRTLESAWRRCRSSLHGLGEGALPVHNADSGVEFAI